MQPRHRAILCCLALIAPGSLIACAGDITTVSGPATRLLARDGAPLSPDAAPATPQPTEPDLGTQPEPDTRPPLPGPGDLCPAAECTDDALCLGGICHRKCVSHGACNERAPSSCGASEVCLPATSFSDACYPATAKLGELCGPDGDGALCQAGMLCITAGEAKARCMSLCQDGCAAAQQCAATTNGCEVCLIL